MNHMMIGNKHIGRGLPTYFIADIGANHNGNLERAKELIYLCAEAGADAAKFQHFSANTIVSDHGFKSLGSQKSHQANWKKSVYEIYKDASINIEWTGTLKETCHQAGVEFLTSPYSIDLVDIVDPFVPAYKIGSGDITWLEIINHMAFKKKPLLLATGSASFEDVCRAVDNIFLITKDIVLMQCNTNYTGSIENFKFVNLNVLNSYQHRYPDVLLGLSDHTPGHATVLGAVALGACVIEKHFTDNTKQEGPDHSFSMDPVTWKDMVMRTRELELALGSSVKKIEDNEKETVVLQRRSIRARKELIAGTVLLREDVEVLRPCPVDAIPPYQINDVIGSVLNRDIKSGENIKWNDLKK